MKVCIVYRYITVYLNTQSVDGVVSQDELVNDSDLKGSEAQGARQGPVLLTLGLLTLHQVSDHHNGRDPLLPYHPPEIYYSGGHGT